MKKIFNMYNGRSFVSDFKAGLTVFLVAIPLCLGIAVACKTPIESGLIAGISGGIITGSISGSHTSITGPSAGFVAVVIDAISSLQNYHAFLCAVIFAGIFQILFSVLKLGRFGGYIPSSVINGLLFAIGLILVLKQLPHLFGYNATPTGDFEFLQADNKNTFSEIFHAIQHIDIGAFIIGIGSLLIIWWCTKYKRKLVRIIPASLFAVIFGIIMTLYCQNYASNIILQIHHSQLVNLPYQPSSFTQTIHQLIHFPDFASINWQVIKFGMIIAIVVSLEAIISISAGDKLDKQKRHTPINRELIAQGLGNIVSGFLGGIPVTSVVVRTAVNVESGGRTKIATILHGVLLIIAMLFIPKYINMIPLSCLAAILIHSGLRLMITTNLKLIYSKGSQYYIPFICTVIFIIFSNVLTGVSIGVFIGFYFVIKTNYIKSFSFKKYTYHAGEILKIHLPQEISFLNKPSLVKTLDSIPNKACIIIDATNTEYIDQDSLDAIREFKTVRAKLHSIKVNTVGFHNIYNIENRMHITASVTKEIQKNITPSEVLSLLKEGNSRFATNNRIGHDFKAQMMETSIAQNPLVVILSCMDSRAIPETIFDLGIGEALIIRIAGNITNHDITGSIEFGCKVLGAKLVVILGHTMCGAVKAACNHEELENATNLIKKIGDIVKKCTSKDENLLLNEAIELNVKETKNEILSTSKTLFQMKQDNEIDLVSGVYDIKTGIVKFL